MMAAPSTTPNLRTTSSEGRSWQKPTTTRPSPRPSETGRDVADQRRLKPSTWRSLSPLASRTLSTGSSSPAATPLRSSSLNKRSQSAERRRSVTPTPVKAAIGAQISSAAKVLMSSKRGLSLSFQGESLSSPISKTKPAPPPNFAKATAERRTMSAEQRPWPARSRQVNSVRSLSKSVDLGSDRKKLICRSRNVIRSSKPSLADGNDQVLCDDKLQDIMSNALLNGDNGDVSSKLLNLTNLSISAVESAASDTESICSESNSGLQDNGIMSQSQGVIVPARVWELTKNQMRRMVKPSSPLCISSSVKATVLSSPPINHTSSRGVSPFRGGVRPASPSRLNTTPLPSEKPPPTRTMASPSRVRNGTADASGSITCSVPSLLCLAADVRRGKLGQNRISDAHLLRLLYNRHLQWRFANSIVEATMSFQRLNAERNLFNTWKAMSDLRLSICNWRLELSRLSLKVKLFSILKEQMMNLQKWAVMEKDHVSSLLGATESFSASTVQLPFVCGATADILNLKGAICSAVDVLQAMASSICSLMSEVENINSLLDEVVSVAASEQVLLDKCKDLLAAIAAFQVKDCSLRGHISQLKRASSLSLPIEA